MSKVNTIRLINLNYGLDKVAGKTRLSDVQIDCHQKNTFINLENAGGKSLIIQNIQSLLVSHDKRNLKQRKLADLYRTSDSTLPTMIMMELALDNHNGYLLLGKVIMKAKVATDPITVYNFISYYRDPNSQYSIRQLPIFDVVDGKYVYKKTIEEIRECLKTWSSDKTNEFTWYNFTHGSDAEYYQQLKRYGLDSKVFDHTSYKINCSESGITKLYEQYTNQDKFVSEEIFPIIYDKRQQSNGMFRGKINDLLQKRLKNDQQIQLKVFRDKIIQGELNERLIPLTKEYFVTYDYQQNLFATMTAMQEILANKKHNLEVSMTQKQTELKDKDKEIHQVDYQIKSVEYYHQAKQLANAETALENAQEERQKLEDRQQESQAEVDLQDCLYIQGEINGVNAKLQVIEKQIASQNHQQNTQQELKETGANLYQAYQCLIKQQEQAKQQIDNRKASRKDKKEQLEKQKTDLTKALTKLNGQIARLETKNQQFSTLEKNYNHDFKEELSFEKNLFHDYLVKDLLENHQKDLDERFKDVQMRLEKNADEQKENVANKVTIKQAKDKQEDERFALVEKLTDLKPCVADLKQQLQERQAIINHYQLSQNYLDDRAALEQELSVKIYDLDKELMKMSRDNEHLHQQLTLLDSGNVEKISPDLAASLADLGIDYQYGIDILKEQGKSATQYLQKNAILPYALVIQAADFKRLKDHQEELVYTDKPVYMMNRDCLRRPEAGMTNPVSTDQASFVYARFNQELLDEASLESKKEEIKTKIERLADQINNQQAILTHHQQKLIIIQRQDFSQAKLDEANRQLAQAEQKERDLSDANTKLTSQLEKLDQKLETLKEEKYQCQTYYKALERQQEAWQQLLKGYQEYVTTSQQIEKLKQEFAEKERCQEEQEVAIEQLGAELEEINNDILHVTKEITKLEQINQAYLDYQTISAPMMSHIGSLSEGELKREIEQLSIYYQQLQQKLASVQDLLAQKQVYHQQRQEKEKRLADKIEESQLAVILPEYQLALEERNYSEYDNRKAQHKIEQLRTELKVVDEQIIKLNKEQTRCLTLLTTKQEEIKQLGHSAAIAEELLEHLSYQDQLVYYKKETMRLNGAKETIAAQIEQLTKQIITVQQELARVRGRFGPLIQSSVEVTKDLVEEVHEMLNQHKLEQYIDDKFSEDVQVKQTLKNQQTAIKQQIKRMATGVSMLKNAKSYQNLLDNTEQSIEVNDPLIIKNQQTYVETYEKRYHIYQKQVDEFENDVKEIAQLIAIKLEELATEINKIDNGTAITINQKNEKLFMINVKSDLLEDREALKLHCQQYLETIIHKYYKTSADEQQALYEEIGFENIFRRIIGFENITISFKAVSSTGRVSKLRWEKVQQSSNTSGAQKSCIYLAILLSIMNYISKNSSRNIESTEGKFLIMDNPFGQTQSPGFIKVMLDIAKKSNMQFISFSAITMPDIYTQFEKVVLLQAAPPDAQGIHYMTQHVVIGEQANEDDANQMYVANIENHNAQIDLDI